MARSAVGRWAARWRNLPASTSPYRGSRSIGHRNVYQAYHSRGIFDSRSPGRFRGQTSRLPTIRLMAGRALALKVVVRFILLMAFSAVSRGVAAVAKISWPPCIRRMAKRALVGEMVRGAVIGMAGLAVGRPGCGMANRAGNQLFEEWQEEHWAV